MRPVPFAQQVRPVNNGKGFEIPTHPMSAMGGKGMEFIHMSAMGGKGIFPGHPMNPLGGKGMEFPAIPMNALSGKGIDFPGHPMNALSGKGMEFPGLPMNPLGGKGMEFAGQPMNALLGKGMEIPGANPMLALMGKGMEFPGANPMVVLNGKGMEPNGKGMDLNPMAPSKGLEMKGAPGRPPVKGKGVKGVEPDRLSSAWRPPTPGVAPAPTPFAPPSPPAITLRPNPNLVPLSRQRQGAPERYVGAIRVLESESGIIDCPTAASKFGQDVFIKICDIPDGGNVGSKMTFDVELVDGRPQASNGKLV